MSYRRTHADSCIDSRNPRDQSALAGQDRTRRDAPALLVLIPAEGAIGLTLVVAGLVGAGAVLAGGYWFLAKRGVLRWAGLALAIVAVVFVIVAFFRADAILVALISLALVAVGGVAARHALRHTAQPWMPTRRRAPGRAPVHRDEPPLGRREGRSLRPEEQGRSPGRRGRAAGRTRLRRRRRPGPRTPSTAAPTCSASPAATAPRPWSPASPPTTTSRCW